jgi:hypothetical protein
VNLYAYVGNDPVDGRDPTGLARCGESLSTTQCATVLKAQTEALKQTQQTLAAVRNLQKERAEITSGKRDQLSAGALKTEGTLRAAINEGRDVSDRDVTKVVSHLSFTAEVLSSDKYRYEAGAKGGDTAAHTWLGWSSIMIDARFYSTSFANQVSSLTHEPNHIIGSNILPMPWPESYGSAAHGLWNADTYSNIIESCQNWCGK